MAIVLSGCFASSIPDRQQTEQLIYVHQQTRDRARVLGQQFQELEEIVPPGLVGDADLLARDWHALAIGDVEEPPCDQMRAAYEALGNWLLLQYYKIWVRSDTKLSSTHVEAAAMNWQFNAECKDFLLGSANVQ